MDYRDLPYDAEVGYLEGTGTQWIQTNYVPTGTNINVYTKITYNGYSNTTTYLPWYAAYTGEQQETYRIIKSGSATNKVWLYNGKKANGEGTEFSVSVGETYTISFEGNQYNINGITGTVSQTSSGSNTGVFTLFNSTATNGLLKGRFYYFKVTKGGATVLDLIPVRVGNVGYMYDKVSGQLFGNYGTGSFVLGPDVAPGRCANEVAFLESWGNQYIDTGITPSTDSKIELKCLYCKSGAGFTSYGSLIGADDSSNAYILSHSAVANFTYGLEFSNNFANPQTRLLTFDSTTSPQNMRVYDEGGSLVTTLTCIRGVFEVNQNLYLFATNRSGTPVCGSNRIMYCKIYDGDTLVRDYVPVEYNGIGYMYDKVSGLFFDNQGTGKFLFGSIAKACARSYTRRQLMAAQEYDILQGGLLSANCLIPLDINPYGTTWSFEGSIEKYGSSTLGAGTKMISSNLNNTTYREYRFTFTAISTFSICTYTRATSTYWTSWTVSGTKVVFSTNKTTEATVNGETKTLKNGSGNVYTSSPQLRLGDWGLQRCQMIFHYLKAWNNDVLMSDYVVARRRKDNVLGVLNRVNGKFIVPTRGTLTTI